MSFPSLLVKVFENGNYRLNFHGRVTVPSVKNFQLVDPKDVNDVVCQVSAFLRGKQRKDKNSSFF
jgi:hypothetical protein